MSTIQNECTRKWQSLNLPFPSKNLNQLQNPKFRLLFSLPLPLKDTKNHRETITSKTLKKTTYSHSSNHFDLSPISKMPKPFTSLFSSRKPKTIDFKDYYTNWFNTLKKTLLPLIQKSLSSSSSQTLLCSHVDLLLHHFLSYYDALDLAASQENLPQLLFPSWRNSLEIPFLFLGDLHPYLFTNLVRSFLDKESEEESEEDDEFCSNLGLVDACEKSDASDSRPWQVSMAWENVSKDLMARTEQIECGLRLMVPALISRMKKAQGGFVGRIAEDWVAFEGNSEGLKEVIGEAMKDEMEDMVSVFVDANRLRKSVIAEIVGVLSVYQAALFLETLAQFLVGLRDRKVVGEFEQCKTPYR